MLVDGRDVDGVAAQAPVDGCRIYFGSSDLGGVPPVERIVATLLAEREGVPRADGWRNGWGIPVAALASLPALLPVGICPACWPAYAGLLSAFGMGFLLESRYLLPLMVTFFGLALAALAYRASSRRGFGPLIAGAAAVGWTLVFKFAIPVPLAAYAGLGGLVAASAWNSWPKKAVAAGNCPHCVSTVSDPPSKGVEP
ncbi:MAG: hypothetical protein Q9Q40_04395 [Acidobacteriota bacterium]|nr:hypothetical protein [Acidobacteriota bacterium]